MTRHILGSLLFEDGLEEGCLRREGRNCDILSDEGKRERKGLDLLSSIRLKKNKRHSFRFICCIGKSVPSVFHRSMSVHSSDSESLLRAKKATSYNRYLAVAVALLLAITIILAVFLAVGKDKGSDVTPSIAFETCSSIDE